MTILLVEDNPDDVELTRLALARSNILNELIVASDGVETLELLHGAGGVPPQPQPLVELLDLKLPRLDGFEVLARIRAHPSTAHLPVVVMTASSQERDLTGRYQSGANSYIVKPVDFEQFMVAAQTIGMYWLMLNHNAPEVR